MHFPDFQRIIILPSVSENIKINSNKITHYMWFDYATELVELG